MIEGNEMKLSIIFPIYNEEGILRNSVDDIYNKLKNEGTDFEIILIENGSKDKTLKIAKELKKESKVNLLILKQANYGNALRKGMLNAKGDIIVLFDIDYYDVNFLNIAMSIIENYETDVVIGTKNILLSEDTRPVLRRIISRGYTLCLKMLFGLKSSDTHGIKVFKNTERLMQLINKTKMRGSLFDSELIIRMEKDGLNISELPVKVVEKRISSKGIIKRVLFAIIDLIKLRVRF